MRAAFVDDRGGNRGRRALIGWRRHPRAVNFVELCRVASDEALSAEYLQGKCGKRPGCGHCGSRRPYQAKGKNRLRCAGCGKDPGPFSRTRLGSVRIAHSEWLVIIKLFELSVPAGEAAREMGLGYRTTRRAFDALRLAIASELAKSDGALRGEIKAAEERLWGRQRGGGGRGKGRGKVVLGALERRGRVSLEIVPGARADELAKEALKADGAGGTAHAGRWDGYDSLILHGYERETANRTRMFSKATASANALRGFWSFAKERMPKRRGMGREEFILYAKEMEWRHNNSGRDLFETLARYMLAAPNK